MTTTSGAAWPTTLAAYKKAIPQVAVVAGYAWVVISDRLSTGGHLDGVTLVAAGLALLQGILVVLPANPWAKALWSLGAVAGQALTAVVSDGHPSQAEVALLIGAIIAWAAGAGVVNTVDRSNLVKVAVPADRGSATVSVVARVLVLLLAAAALWLIIVNLTPVAPTSDQFAGIGALAA